MEWIMNNLGTLICGLVVALVVGLALRSVIREKRSGKCSCGGNCGACGACSAIPSGALEEARKNILNKKAV